MAFTDLASSKINAYAATRPSDLAATKVNAYAAQRPVDLAITKINAYAVVFAWQFSVTTPAIYPTLPTGFSVLKRPKFFTGSAESGSGWQVRVGYSPYPLWEIDLTYEVLSDESPAFPTNDFRNLLGFFLSQNGDLNGFIFPDPDDNAVTSQAVATGDGTTKSFTLFRSYGGIYGTGTEPVGFVNLGNAFNVYLGGVLQSSSTYTVVTTTPVNQQLKFNSAPGASVVITVDMSYYFYVHFQAPMNEFEKFMDRLWSMKKLTLESLRG